MQALTPARGSTVNFNWTSKTERAVIFTATAQTDFYNLKNRAEGARRYGYTISVVKYANPDGETAFRSDYQTLLNGTRYQSSKQGEFVATEAEARAALDKTVAGAMKRYAKLALDPASKIELRP
jgi:hypothetical protein